MPWVKVPVTDILILVKELHYHLPKDTPVPKDEVVLEVHMGRGGSEWGSQEFTVRVGESFMIPLVAQGNEGIGKADTWPLEGIGGE